MENSTQQNSQKYNKKQAFAFVIDINGRPLSPTNANRAWYFVRIGKAKLIDTHPLTIQLFREVEPDPNDKSRFVEGIDDGAKHTGIAITHVCETKNKVVFKGTLEQRGDVHDKMTERKQHRQHHRRQKRYRKQRFNNRSSSKRKGRLAPTIHQNKQATLRVEDKLTKYCPINDIRLENVKFDIRVLTEEKKLKGKQYQKSNRLDENLRIATIMRDKNICQLCGKKKGKFETHHITPKRLGGADSIYNLITLCDECHKKVTGHEMDFAEKFYKKIEGKQVTTQYAQHVMQGKNYLKEELSKTAPVTLTTGGDTANTRNDWNIEKSHSNDAVCIAGFKPQNINILEYTIKPIRKKKNKTKCKSFKGFEHRDLIKYTKKNGEFYIGYVTALHPESKQISFKTKEKQYNKMGIGRCKILRKANRLMFTEVC